MGLQSGVPMPFLRQGHDTGIYSYLRAKFRMVTKNATPGSAHYTIYGVCTSWNSFDLTLSHHKKISPIIIYYTRQTSTNMKW